MSKHDINGTSTNTERRLKSFLRDTRPTSVVVMEKVMQTGVSSVSIASMGAVGFLFPSMILPMTVASSLYWLLVRNVPTWAPMRLPIQTKTLDPLDPNPGNRKPQMAAGAFYVGNCIESNKQIWAKVDDLRRHIAMFATTGGGKTEALMGFIANTLCWNSGGIFVDGKAETNIYGKIVSMARRMSRDDDVLSISYIRGGRDDGGDSHRFNPYMRGSSKQLVEQTVSLMEEGSGDGMWRGRAISLVSAVLPPLTYKRDHHGLLLHVGVVRDYMSLGKIMELAKSRDIPEERLEALAAYLKSLPGYKDGMPVEKQSSTTLDQHGYLQMQFTRILGELADTYGYIYKTPLADVDMLDVVVNRRLLCVLIPALENSQESIGQLGRIIVASIKNMMAMNIGDELEGKSQRLYKAKATNSRSPFPVILDECGYYLEKGAALMFAQGRSLGFCFVAATQDFPSMERTLKDEATSIMGNTLLKYWGKITDTEKTLPMLKKQAGEAYVTRAAGFRGTVGSIMASSYQDRMDASIEKTDRVDQSDVLKQIEGEYHLTFEDRLIRCKTFYADPGYLTDMRMNRFLRMRPPEESQIATIDIDIQRVIENLRNPASMHKLASDRQSVDEIAMATFGYLRLREFGMGSAESSCGAIVHMANAMDQAGATTWNNGSDGAVLDPVMAEDAARHGIKDPEKAPDIEDDGELSAMREMGLAKGQQPGADPVDTMSKELHQAAGEFRSVLNAPGEAGRAIAEVEGALKVNQEGDKSAVEAIARATSYPPSGLPKIEPKDGAQLAREIITMTGDTNVDW